MFLLPGMLVMNAEGFLCAECMSTEALIVRAQLPWAGCVVQMDDTQKPEQLLYAELQLARGSSAALGCV